MHRFFLIRGKSSWFFPDAPITRCPDIPILRNFSTASPLRNSAQLGITIKDVNDCGAHVGQGQRKISRREGPAGKAVNQATS